MSSSLLGELCAGVGVFGCTDVVGEVACETLARFLGGISRKCSHNRSQGLVHPIARFTEALCVKILCINLTTFDDHAAPHM